MQHQEQQSGSRILRSFTDEQGHFPEHRQIEELVCFPIFLTVPLLSSLFPADAYNFTSCSRGPRKGNGFQCRFMHRLGTLQLDFLHATANTSALQTCEVCTERHMP